MYVVPPTPPPPPFQEGASKLLTGLQPVSASVRLEQQRAVRSLSRAGSLNKGAGGSG